LRKSRTNFNVRCLPGLSAGSTFQLAWSLNQAIAPASASSVPSVTMIPQNYIKLEGPAANTMIRLMEALEEHDDVQNVHSNFDIDQKLLEEVAG
jgi:transcriptional/translational regulatory protein YebC/TACO1